VIVGAMLSALRGIDEHTAGQFELSVAEYKEFERAWFS
jgi:hypothetical protein